MNDLQVSQIGADMKYCSGCGKPVHKTARACPNCGAPQVGASDKNKVVAGLLALFLGGLGIHKFYLGQGVWGIIYLVFCWTFIPAIIAFFEAIIILTMSDDKFSQKFG